MKDPTSDSQIQGDFDRNSPLVDIDRAWAEMRSRLPAQERPGRRRPGRSRALLTSVGVLIVLAALSVGVYEAVVHLGGGQGVISIGDDGTSSSVGMGPSTTASPASGAVSTSSTIPAIALPPLVSVHMTDAGSEWAVTQSALVRSTDGGATWTDITPPELRAHDFGDVTLVDGSAANLATLPSDKAWFASTSSGRLMVYRTSDGGAHWASSPAALAGGNTSDNLVGVAGIDFVDDAHGWILGSLGAAAGSEPVALFRTTDGGATWNVLLQPTPDQQEPGGLPFAGDKTGFAFADNDRGWLTGASAAGGVWLYTTADGGATWQPAGLPIEGSKPGEASSGFFLTWPPFHADDTWVLPVSGSRPGSSGGPLSFLAEFAFTSDLGSSWKMTTTIDLDGQTNLLWSWPDAKHGLVATDTGWVVTDNAGASWRATPRPSALQGLTQMQFVSPEEGWAVAEGRLLRTTDGGATWTRAGAAQ